MRNTFTIFCTIIFSCLMYGCASSDQATSSQPGWVHDPYALHSESEYMAAVSSGSTQNAAQDQALSSLAGIFESRVEGDQTVQEEFEEWEEGEEWYSESRVEVVNFSRVRTEQDLVNAQVVETHQEGNQWYALAVLNRNETIRLLEDRISENRQDIADLEEAAETQSRIYRKLGLLQQARGLALENEVMATQRSVLRGGGSVDRSDDLSRLSSKVRDVRDECIISISGNDEAKDVMPAVSEVFQGMGYITGDSGVLEAKVEFVPQYADLNRDDAEFARWTLNITLNDPELGQTIATFSHDGRDGALSYNDAVMRAEYSARQHIERYFGDFVVESVINDN